MKIKIVWQDNKGKFEQRINSEIEHLELNLHYRILNVSISNKCAVISYEEKK